MDITSARSNIFAYGKKALFFIYFKVYHRQEIDQFLLSKTVETDGVHFSTVLSNIRVTGGLSIL